MHVFGHGALAGHRCALQPAVSTTARGREDVPNGESAAARLNHPWDVKVDKLATIVVANGLNHRLRKILGQQITRGRVTAKKEKEGGRRRERGRGGFFFKDGAS